MAVASLTRFTVPLASDQSAQNQGLLMPKLKYRFRVIFENFGETADRTELTKQVVSAGRPEVSFEEVVLDVYNSKIKLAGKPSWNDIQIVIRDDALGTVSRMVGEQLQRQFDFFEQSSAQAGIVYKFTTKIEMLDGGNGADTPIPLETWELYGCYLTTVGYGDLNYGESNPVELTLTVKYDNALQTPQGTGVGAAIERRQGATATG
jgi:hypothetical protein